MLGLFQVLVERIGIARRLPSLVASSFLGAAAPALWLEQALAAKHDHDPPVAHHREQSAGLDDCRGGHALVAGVQALDVERAELVLDDVP